MDFPSPLPLLCVGGSAGSLRPLQDLVGGLPEDLPAAVLVTVHTGDQRPSRLPEVLGRHSALTVTWAEDGCPLRAGEVRIAPPGRHLIVWEDALSLSRGPRVNRHRPSIDVLLASAARARGPRTVAVVLSGVLDDGAAGSAMVVRAGGRVLAQDPADAEFASMPAAALAAAPGARAVGRLDLASAAVEMMRQAAGRTAPVPHSREEGHAMTMADSDDPSYLGEGESALTRLTCPECNGGLARVDLPQITYFRCHVGHQYGPQTLAAAQADASEARLWSAVAALQEQAAVSRFLRSSAGMAEPGGQPEPQELTDRAEALLRLAKAWSVQQDAGTPQE